MSVLALHLLHHSDPYVVASVAPGSTIDWERGDSALFSVTHTATETSVIAPAALVPEAVRSEGPFDLFEVAGPLDFTMVGVLAGILVPVADKGITVVTTSTYQTDWILVPSDNAEQAEQIWRREGFLVTPPVLGGPR